MPLRGTHDGFPAEAHRRRVPGGWGWGLSSTLENGEE